MARQDYILSALKDLKAHMENFDNKLDLIKEKTHHLELKQERLAQAQESNNEDWIEHMSRTKLNEQRVHILENMVEQYAHTIKDLEKLSKTTSESLIKIAGWITHQQDKKNAQKEVMDNVLAWGKRILYVIAASCAAFGGYEGILKLLEYL